MTRTAEVFAEDDWFVARCVELDIASQGRVAGPALANLREAVEAYFEETNTDGFVEQETSSCRSWWGRPASSGTPS